MEFSSLIFTPPLKSYDNKLEELYYVPRNQRKGPEDFIPIFFYEFT